MSLKSEQIRALRAQAHSLKPFVMIGNKGLTETVVAAINIALDDHELIKIKIAADRDERAEITASIIAQTGAELIQTIGQMTVIYRKKPE